jgi:hypothetical protein
MGNSGKLLSGIFSIMVVVAMTSLPLQAQEFNAGVFGGMNGSQVDRDGYGGYNKLSTTAGAFVNREFTKNFSWQLEIKYGGRGAYYVSTDYVIEYKKTSFHYLELPLSVNYIHHEKIQGELGISPDVLISYARYDDQRNKVPVDDQMEGNNRFGLNAFAGLYYWFKPAMGLGLRFTYSVIPYSMREGEAIRYLDKGYFHNVFSLTFAYRIFHPS